MAVQLLSIGYQITLTQNVIVALPASRCLIFSSTAGVTLQQSNDVAFADNAALTLTSGQAEVGGGFLRSTAGNCVVTLKKM